MAPVYSNGFDAHTHLQALSHLDAVQTAMERARAAGISQVAVLGGDPDQWDNVAQVARAIGAIYGLGVHPWWASAAPDVSVVRERLDAAQPPVVGEIGLDRVRGALEEQQPLFCAQLAWAAENDRPVVLHAVRAVDEVVSQVARHRGVRAMIHSFTGSEQQMRRAVQTGLYLSIGPLALRASGRMVDVIRSIPANRLLLETDSPAHDAPCDEPAGLVAVARSVAALRGMDASALLAQTGDVARAFYGLSTSPEVAS